MKIPKRISAAIVTGVVICAAYAWFFGTQTFIVWETHRLAHANQSYWTKPANLPDATISSAPGKTLSCSGYQLEVPWTDVAFEKKIGTAGRFSVVMFHSGIGVSFIVSEPIGLVSLVNNAQHVDPNFLPNQFGQSAALSDYDFQLASLETTPASFSIWMSEKKAVRLNMLFLEKPATLDFEKSSEVFLVDTRSCCTTWDKPLKWLWLNF
jgi:hypothetical protein